MKIAEAKRIMDSSFTTYSSWEMAVARMPVPSTAVPVFVMRFGEEGILSMISDARWEGGGGLAEPAIERLQKEKRERWCRDHDGLRE